MNGEKTIENLKKTLVQILKRKILVPESYLAGGSALYFYLRHRLSIDLDFFVPKPFASEAFVFKMRVYFDDAEKEINSILLTDQSGRVRSVSKKEWEETKNFFKRFCL